MRWLDPGTRFKEGLGAIRYPMKRARPFLLIIATLMTLSCVIHQRPHWDGAHYMEVYYPGNTLQMVRDH